MSGAAWYAFLFFAAYLLRKKENNLEKNQELLGSQKASVKQNKT